MRKWVANCLAALLGIIAIGGVWTSIHLHQRLEMAQAQLKAAAEQRQTEQRKPEPASNAGSVVDRHVNASTPSPKDSEELVVRGCHYEGEDLIVLDLSRMPDMTVIRKFVEVSPMKGACAFSCRKDYETNKYDTNNYLLFVNGDFAYCTNFLLKVKAGLPDKAGKCALAVDFTKSLQRKDAPPRVSFAVPGRYLPPTGPRLLAVDSINVSRLRCAAAAIAPQNIVQLLARENSKYSACYHHDVDSKYTEDIADGLHEWEVKVDSKLNQHVYTPLALRNLSDAASNGVFLVAVRSADRARRDDRWWWEEDSKEDPRLKWNPQRYRLVCVTDIGLTVRQSEKNVQVWATSLVTGAPVGDCEVSVYSSSNRLLGKGRTDARGLCLVPFENPGEAESDRRRRGDAFAVVARTADGKDTSFVCLSDRQEIGEMPADGERPRYLAGEEVAGFAWTERKIYRHDESIFVHALVRNADNAAPKPFPVEFRLYDPNQKCVQRHTVMLDKYGSASYGEFKVPAELPSGRWSIELTIPGDGKHVRSLACAKFSVEEFAPPQIRVKVDSKSESAKDFAFGVKAEHLYGGPAKALRSEGAVVFEDERFAPDGWKGWRFGDDRQGLKPNYRRLERKNLDDRGEVTFSAPLTGEEGRPKAAIKAIGQGTVFEEGGRPARARTTRVLHYYPHYIGTTLAGNVRIPASGFAKVKVACVQPNGKRLGEARRLKVSFDRMLCVYSYKDDSTGWTRWSADRVRVPVDAPVKELSTKVDGDVELELPFREDGDYVLTLEDEEKGVAFSGAFWLGDRGDGEVRAPLANPAKVTITPNKELYRPGDVPRILVKAPFAGWALLTVMREKVLYSEVIRLQGPTQEIALHKVGRDWTPNVDVSVSVVQSAENDGYRQNARAHGFATLRVRRRENEVPVKVAAAFAPGSEGGDLTIDVETLGGSATGKVAVVTVVDEGVHLLTSWKCPDPISAFGAFRTGWLPLYDLFDNLLPVWDGDPTKVRGVKTGGGFGAQLLGRVSAVPTRRFKPLALWRERVALEGGRGRTVLRLPEFSGEVRVSAVAYSETAQGAGDVLCKVTPKLVMRGDSPRFVAPGDRFDALLSLANKSGTKGEVKYSLDWSGVGLDGVVAAETNALARAACTLANDADTNVVVAVTAPAYPCTMRLILRSEGCGERHEQTLELPVRPAVGSREKFGIDIIRKGERRIYELDGDQALARGAVREFTKQKNRYAELLGALEFLAAYPYGCLEQTTSRIFPLVTAGGFLNALAPQSKAAKERGRYIQAGVRRVESMIRANDFVMWPDCIYPPWDREVSLYACHFLVEAEQWGVKLTPAAKGKVLEFLGSWMLGDNKGESAYACHTLALAGKAPLDRMLLLYSCRDKLDSLARARLARAFVRASDRPRAEELLKGVSQPDSVCEAAFAILALLELDPNDRRLDALIRYLSGKRSGERYSWGTTDENAHALMAMGAYFRHHPVSGGESEVTIRVDAEAAHSLTTGVKRVVRGGGKVVVENHGEGDAWVAWRKVEIPTPGSVKAEACGISLSRRYLSPAGEEVDMRKIRRGDLIFAELTLSSAVSRSFNDLVIQDLFPAGFEPVLGGMENVYAWFKPEDHGWVMRSDARDDRMLVFSKKFGLKPKDKKRFVYPLRVVSAGRFVLPGPTVEAMYAPEIRAVLAPGTLDIED